MTSSDPEPVELRLANRIRDDLYRITALAEDGVPRSHSIDDLYVVQAGWDFTQEPPLPSRRRSTRWIRRALHRLLFPSLKQQSRYTRASSRVLLDVVERLENVERSLRQPQGVPLGLAPPVGGQAATQLDMRELEDRFRGSPDEISERQRGYLRHFRQAAPVLDLGCGRGEFLALLSEAGIFATGVDRDPALVAGCRERGLRVVHAALLEHLSKERDSSLGGIFCAHVIEHLHPHELMELIRLSATKLRPGGVILLESVNPESFFALAAFYIDITHVRPYHSEAVVWLLERAGFEDVRVEFSAPLLDDDAGRSEAEPDDRHPRKETVVEAAILGPRAYAAIGRKPGHAES